MGSLINIKFVPLIKNRFILDGRAYASDDLSIGSLGSDADGRLIDMNVGDTADILSPQGATSYFFQ